MYNQREGIRNYEREANHARNEAAQEGRRQNTPKRMSVAKHTTGKKTLFGVFLRQKGWNTFKMKHGRVYNDCSAVDKQLMSEIYNRYRNPLDDEGRRVLENARAEVDNHNKDREKVKKTKNDVDTKRRQQRSENPDDFREQRSEHVSNLRSQTRITTSIPSKIEEVISDEDASRFRGTNKKKIELSILAFIRSVPQSVGNPICGNDFKVQVISLFPIFVVHKAKIGRLICFPAEVAVTTFDLVTGLLSSESRFVEFDSKRAYGDTTRARNESQRELILKENKNVDELRKKLGEIIGANGRNYQEHPFDVFEWLMEKLDQYPGAKLVSSQDHFRYVYNGLKLLATYHGLNGNSYFAENIASRLIPIEDLTDVILDHAPLDASSKRSDNYVRESFQGSHLVPLSDKDLFCEFHDNLGTQTKYNCMKAENARLIHIFFKIMEERRLQNFDRSPGHNLCRVDTDPSFKAVVIPDLTITQAKELDDQKQIPTAINTSEQDADPEDEPDQEYDSDEDDQYCDMTNRHHQNNNGMPSHISRQDPIDMPIINTPRVLDYMVYSSDNQHQEDYYDNQHYRYDMQHDNVHYEHLPQRHYDGRYGSGLPNPRYRENGDGWSGSENMGIDTLNRPRPNQNGMPAHLSPNENRSLPRNNGFNETWNDPSHSRYRVSQYNNGITNRGAGAPHSVNGGSRIVEHSPDRSANLGHGRQNSNENIAQQPAQPTPYIENPTAVEFETPTILNNSFNAEESHIYFKTAKKSSTKTFTKINLQSVH